jgi:hypothetical protein
MLLTIHPVDQQLHRGSLVEMTSQGGELLTSTRTPEATQQAALGVPK